MLFQRLGEIGQQSLRKECDEIQAQMILSLVQNKLQRSTIFRLSTKMHLLANFEEGKKRTWVFEVKVIDIWMQRAVRWSSWWTMHFNRGRSRSELQRHLRSAPHAERQGQRRSPTSIRERGREEWRRASFFIRLWVIPRRVTWGVKSESDQIWSLKWFLHLIFHE